MTVEAPPPAIPRRGGSWVLWLAAAISVLSALSPRDLWAPDEPRYGRIAYEMERGGDWLVSHWNGEFDAEKPPLGYWLMAAAGRLAGGVSPAAARLACALLAALAAFAAARVARLWFQDAELGDTAALLFATSGLVLWNSSRAGLDLPLAAFELLALWAGTSMVARPSLVAAAACGASLGLGLLVKGPHALYVPVAGIVGGCLFAGTPRRLLDPRWLATLAVMVAVFLAWLLPALSSGGKAFEDRLIGQISHRVSGVGEPHVHAFPFLVGLVFVCGLPWTPAWAAGALLALRRRRAPEGERFGLGAAFLGTAVPLLLLSIPASKREVYLIPLLPCLAILAAYALHRSPAVRPLRLASLGVALLLLLLAASAFAAPFLAPSLWAGGPDDVVSGSALSEGRMPFALAFAGILALAGGVAALRTRDRPLVSARAAAAGLGVVWVAVALLVLPTFDDTKTWEAAVGPVRSAAPGVRVVACGFTDAALPWAFRPDVVDRVASDPQEVPATLDALFARGAPPIVVAVEAGAWKDAVAKIPSLADRASPLWGRRVGPRVFRILVPASRPN